MARSKETRLQIYVTEKMNDDITEMSELMGISKTEFVRMCVANAVYGYRRSVDIAKAEVAKSELVREE